VNALAWGTRVAGCGRGTWRRASADRSSRDGGPVLVLDACGLRLASFSGDHSIKARAASAGGHSAFERALLGRTGPADSRRAARRMEAFGRSGAGLAVAAQRHQLLSASKDSDKTIRTRTAEA
jgi:hypothetical protein